MSRGEASVSRSLSIYESLLKSEEERFEVRCFVGAVPAARGVPLGHLAGRYYDSGRHDQGFIPQVTKSLLNFQKALALSERSRLEVSRQLLEAQLLERQDVRNRLERELISLQRVQGEAKDPIQVGSIRGRIQRAEAQLQAATSGLAHIRRERQEVEAAAADAMAQIQAARSSLGKQMEAAIAEVRRAHCSDGFAPRYAIGSP